MQFIFFLGLGIFLVLTSCQNNSTDKIINQTFEADSKNMPDDNLREIFYSMYLPNEMSRLLERVGANFYPEILMPDEDFSRYSEENDIATAIGIYGVDLSYAQIYEQNLLSAKYLTTLKFLTPKIGIPEDLYTDLYDNFENYFSNPDSLDKITSLFYMKTDEFLKEAGKNAHAALIVMGGWIEALYIANKILEYNSNNIEILDRIAEQKYSLNSLISLMNNYQDDTYIAESIAQLKKLKQSFDKFDIYYNQKGFQIDTINKTFFTEGYESGLTMDLASEINQLIIEIRNGFVL